MQECCHYATHSMGLSNLGCQDTHTHTHTNTETVGKWHEMHVYIVMYKQIEEKTIDGMEI